MNWKDELNKKEKELNLKKEVINDNTSQGNSSLRDRSNSGRRSNVNLSNLRKKELNKNFKKGGKIMIGREDALKDLDEILNGTYQDKKLTTTEEKLIAIAKVLVKILTTIRSNQLLTDTDKVRIKEARAKRDTEKK